MNQKNYSFLLCSLLMASYSVYGIEVIDDMLHDPFVSNENEDDDSDFPMKRENTASPTELQQDEDNYQWSEKYAQKIARYFFRNDYERITEEDLKEYLKNNSRIATDSLYVENSYMLGVVNGLLEESNFEHKLGLIANSFKDDKQLSNIKDFETIVFRAMNLFGGSKSKVAKKLKELSSEEKNRILNEINAVLQGQPVDRSSKQFNENVQHLVDSFRKEGREGITGFSEILQKAKKLKLSDYFISQLEKLSYTEKENLFLMIDMMLPTKAKVANALELSRVTYIEGQKEKSRRRDLDIRRDAEKRAKEQKEVARALDLANTISNKEEVFSASEQEDIKFDNFSLRRLSKKEQVEKSLELARAVAKNRKDGGSDSDGDMKPGYESGSDSENKDSVTNALDLAKNASKNETSDDQDEDFDENNDGLLKVLFPNDEQEDDERNADL